MTCVLITGARGKTGEPSAGSLAARADVEVAPAAPVRSR